MKNVMIIIPMFLISKKTPYPCSLCFDVDDDDEDADVGKACLIT